MMVIIVLFALTFVFGFALGNRNPRVGLRSLALLSCSPALIVLSYTILMAFALGERSIESLTMYRRVEWALAFGSICAAGVVGVRTGQFLRRGPDGQP